ncbi:Phosphotransferase enzyme family protein [compost metagenome]
MSRMPGIALGTQLGVGDLSRMLELLVGQHRCVLACTVAGLPRLKPRLAERVEHASDLPQATRAGLLQRLWALPDGARLCHGDFHPFNIMVDGDRLGIIDWLDATIGPPEADIARTYLLVALHLPEVAERYLAAMTDDLTMDLRRVMDWLPVVAGARLVEGVDEETERLLAWCRLT